MDALSPPQAWRNSQIERFAQRQLHTRKWINFADVADFCAREAGSIIPDEGKRAAAFQAILKDIMNKEFEENGRSQVLFLNCLRKKTRVTRQDLMDIIEYNY